MFDVGGRGPESVDKGGEFLLHVDEEEEEEKVDVGGGGVVVC